MKIIALFVAGMLTLAVVRMAPASAITAGDLVVVQTGDGTAALNSTGTTSFIKEFAITGTPGQVINLPTAASGSNNPLVLTGNSGSEGFLTLSGDGTFLTMIGYGAAPGTAGVSTASPDVTPRVLGKIDVASGTVDTSVKFATSATPGPADAFNGSNARSAAATDGLNIWLGGNAGSGQGTTAGVRYVTGATSSTRVDTTASNMRVVNVYNGQLYTSSSTGTLLGVSTVGTGLPTANSSAATTGLPGMPTTGTHSAYDFWFKDANTLYVADDGAAASGGGIQKWTQSAGTWSLQYTLLNNGTTTTGVRGLAGGLDTSGNAVLFATSNATSANTMLMVTDTGAASAATILATAPANTAFRGVEYIPGPNPIPEPASLSLLGIASIAFLRRARKA